MPLNLACFPSLREHCSFGGGWPVSLWIFIVFLLQNTQKADLRSAVWCDCCQYLLSVTRSHYPRWEREMQIKCISPWKRLWTAWIRGDRLRLPAGEHPGQSRALFYPCSGEPNLAFVLLDCWYKFVVPAHQLVTWGGGSCPCPGGRPCIKLINGCKLGTFQQRS